MPNHIFKDNGLNIFFKDSFCRQKVASKYLSFSKMGATLEEKNLFAEGANSFLYVAQ